jgi:lysyl endopeptidase
MPAVSNTALRAQHPLPAGVGPLRFAEPLTTEITPKTHGTWETLDDGTQLWRLRIRSAKALSINLGFTTYRMPSGGELFVYAPGYESVIGPFTAKDNAAHGELWTPIVPGDELIVEVTLPTSQRSALQLTLGTVGHGFRPLDAASPAKRSGACNVDVACEEADPWQAQTRAVGRYTVDPGFVCTGALVNNTAGDQTPYFLTANHCGVTPNNAASVVVYWNFENSFCRAPDEDGGRGDGTLDQFSSGAFHRASTSSDQPRYDLLIQGSDFTLLELDTPVDAAFNPYFAGWDRADAATAEAASIHHPQGEEKRISFDLEPTTITSYLEATITQAPTHLRVGNWEVGTTEQGSSGSPLFDANQRIVGILSGGFAGCISSTEDNDQPDWYGRLAWAWDSGDTPDTRLRDWLDPLGTGAVAISGVDLEDDTTPPGPITDFTVASVNANGITLSWQAPGDDGFQGAAAQYEVRYSTAPIRSQAAFDTARAVSGVPIPQPSGATEVLTVMGLQPDTPYYFAVLARDNVNNTSPLATTADNAIILTTGVIVRPGYPNPFRSTTTVGFAVDNTQRVRVDVYDAVGRHVQDVFDETVSANTLREFHLGASGWASGVYFVRIVGDRFERTTQIVRAR